MCYDTSDINQKTAKESLFGYFGLTWWRNLGIKPMSIDYISTMWML